MSIKRFLHLSLLLLALVTVGCQNRDESARENALYKRYAERTDMTVAQVCDFKLCDSVSVDVVLLQADNEAAWQCLVEDFKILDTAGVTSWLGDSENPSIHVKWDGHPVVRVAASIEKHSVGLYCLDNETQYEALLDYQLNNYID